MMMLGSDSKGSRRFADANSMTAPSLRGVGGGAEGSHQQRQQHQRLSKDEYAQAKKLLLLLFRPLKCGLGCRRLRRPR